VPAPLRPLEGLRVLDLSRYLPGPLLTRILADYGAEVLKVEALRGEGMRHLPPHTGGMGAAFGAVNAGKASLALDLKHAGHRDLVLALADVVDVVVESFRPGVMARLGLAPEELMARNPRLIVASLTGYGQVGSRSADAGHDLNYLAHAGLLSLFGPSEGPPMVPGVQVGDVGGGSLPGAMAVLAALLERERSGRGRHLDISLTRGALAFAAVAFPTARAAAGTSLAEPRGEGMLTGGAPCYRCYRARDGRYLAVGALEPHFFATLCAGLGHPEVAAAAYARGDAAREAIATLEAAFATRDAADWVAHFEGQDVCLTLVRTVDEAVADPEFAAVVATPGGHTVLSAERGDASPLTVEPPAALGEGGLEMARTWGLQESVLAACKEERP
jgi:alpha-methylacyl-CoA racemase